MKTKYIIKALFILCLTFAITSCGYDEEVINDLDVNRAFAPVALTANIRNQTTVELNWTVRPNISKYLVEFSADDPNFTSIFKTVEVIPSQLPIQVALEGETVYSIRVKAISSIGLEDSTWAIETATTLTEQIMLPFEPGDVAATKVTFRWVANSNVTQLVLQPGDITHIITAQEKTDGIATVTGLTGETAYTAKLFNSAKIRGTAAFTTGIDVGDNTLVLPTDDLFQMIADAAPGDILLLEQGDYTSQTGTITLDKSITIQGLRRDFKPSLKVSFSIVTGAANVSLIDLNLTGDTPSMIIDVVRYSDVGNYNSLLISGCNIHDYDRSFIAGNVTDAIVQSLTVEDCIATNILTNGGDFIDFRNSDVLNVNVNTSTFNNCAPGRDFFRLDDAGTSTQKGVVCNVLLDRCTLYGCSNTDDRILYVRFQTNKITVTNNLFAETSAYYSNQSKTDPTPTFSKNNYYNAPAFYATSTVFDSTTTYTTLNPGFTNAAGGNFTISNQTLKDNNVGDPRWRL
ncbi:uncharacterized protein DUF5123 [Mariniflexile fucanivorans]|uniref:Uncharacterized protein DUF5123 n=1 Tax=Mariniflexile fucanivorans TaxID=264023 RepID=A0A4R1RH78_9FLAO|nr:DUF5123 domain-containing protein [Mariniflexile fucanivorans]TCL65394.1 uncharacterized protein DUF5123 [Mariniflexile fucanivorans]